MPSLYDLPTSELNPPANFKGLIEEVLNLYPNLNSDLKVTFVSVLDSSAVKDEYSEEFLYSSDLAESLEKKLKQLEPEASLSEQIIKILSALKPQRLPFLNKSIIRSSNQILLEKFTEQCIEHLKSQLSNDELVDLFMPECEFCEKYLELKLGLAVVVDPADIALIKQGCTCDKEVWLSAIQ